MVMIYRISANESEKEKKKLHEKQLIYFCERILLVFSHFERWRWSLIYGWVDGFSMLQVSQIGMTPCNWSSLNKFTRFAVDAYFNWLKLGWLKYICLVETNYVSNTTHLRIGCERKFMKISALKLFAVIHEYNSFRLRNKIFLISLGGHIWSLRLILMLAKRLQTYVARYGIFNN